MDRSVALQLPRGIVSVVQTAFHSDLTLDLDGTDALVEDAIAAGVDGLLVPAVASEVAYLTRAERRELLARVSARAAGRVPVIAGISAGTAAECLALAQIAAEYHPAAFLASIPSALYGRPEAVDAFVETVIKDLPGALVLQDLQFDGPGLPVEQIATLRRRLPRLVGIKIETVPAGPKYSAVRAVCGDDFWIAGGWAVPQMIEALDRGVDALVPESSLIRIYKAIEQAHRCGQRPEAMARFHELLPVLAFTNQELATSVAFFKRLLVRRGIFRCPAQRMPLPAWDEFSERRTQELIERCVSLERRLAES